MKINKSSIENLVGYIKNNEVVYQTYNGLIEVSNNENKENLQELLAYFEQVSSIELFEKGDSFIHEPFEELDNWATNNDYLFLLEIIGVLICIPKKCVEENDILSA